MNTSYLASPFILSPTINSPHLLWVPASFLSEFYSPHTHRRVLWSPTHPRSSIFTSFCLCVHLTLTPCQTNDRSCNRMSAFLDSMALFSVPTRQIAKKVKLSISTITGYKNAIFPSQSDAFYALTNSFSPSLPYITTYV